jgi:insecticidal toxin complex protein TccC
MRKSTDDAKINRCGQLIHHDDPAGSVLFSGYDLTGKLLSQTRHLLKDQRAADWPEDLDERKGLVDSGTGHTTTWRYAPTGEVLEQMDAKRNTQRFWFDVAGQLQKVTLQLSGATQQKLILDQVSYNAQGQIESQVLGGKITSAATYAPENGRMNQRIISRTGTSALQKLHYAYDAVGNVLSVEDHSKPEQHNANQRIKPGSTYAYDSLYQLVKATGREEQTARIHAALPDWVSSPADRSRLLNFTQRYTYDERANLTTLQHQREGNNYTRTMHIAPDSNRGLSWKSGDPPPDFATGFDANGNLQALQTGQPMTWNARNQLQSVTLVDRAEQEADTESYLYDGNGQRVRKRQTQKAHALIRCRDVLYLPGLEFRESTTEKLEVITVQAGNCNVRCLHWSLGTPSAINNDALRFSFDDHLGSNTMELDAEGNLISEEGYYPFGGTAWRAARNVLEAKFRTIRYSGKERDASGLYYYGQRYYAPWLQRWISPDPTGTADGLNLYCMVGNNPVKFVDHQGLGKADVVDQFESWGRGRSVDIMNAANRKPSTSRDTRFTPAVLKKLTAHAYAINTDSHLGVGELFNLEGPPSGPKNYRGVDQSYVGASSQDHYLAFGSYKVENTGIYLEDLAERYTATKSDALRQIHFSPESLRANPLLSRTIEQAYELQQPVRDFIASHIDASNGIVPVLAGGPGAHAEVRALNSIVALYTGSAERLLGETTIFTDTLRRGKTPQPFIACHNCSGIIPEEVTIPTGRNSRNYAAFNHFVSQLNSEAAQP